MARWLYFFFLPYLLFAHTELFLIRHGETDWNIDNRMQGVTDNLLNEKGVAQAKAVAKKMEQVHPDLQGIYSSDLQRAYATAHETAQKLHLPIEIRPSLREYDWGKAEGLTPEERKAFFGEAEKGLKEEFPSWRERWNHTPYPGAETFNECLGRFRSELLAIAKEHPDEKVAIFTHARAIRLLVSDLLNAEMEAPLPNCGVVHLHYFPENEEHPLRFVDMESLLD